MLIVLPRVEHWCLEHCWEVLEVTVSARRAPHSSTLSLTPWTKPHLTRGGYVKSATFSKSLKNNHPYPQPSTLLLGPSLSIFSQGWLFQIWHYTKNNHPCLQPPLLLFCQASLKVLHFQPEAANSDLTLYNFFCKITTPVFNPLLSSLAKPLLKSSIFSQSWLIQIQHYTQIFAK